MGLSIVQRIIAGFVLMLLLLILLGVISTLKIRGINDGLSEVSDRATPLVMAVAGLKEALQESNRWVLEFRTSEEAGELPTVEQVQRSASTLSTIESANERIDGFNREPKAVPRCVTGHQSVL